MTTSFMMPAVAIPGKIGQLEAMPVQVNGMQIVALIAHGDAITPALLQVK